MEIVARMELLVQMSEKCLLAAAAMVRRLPRLSVLVRASWSRISPSSATAPMDLSTVHILLKDLALAAQMMSVQPVSIEMARLPRVAGKARTVLVVLAALVEPELRTMPVNSAIVVPLLQRDA